ncbi:MAG: hypothetical protein KAI61_01620 [Alphaproteobacteria bacterium]|nr:hypothetical protein [Alphaproteobacteria bacterium]MCK5518089.1 hypothetical protein [Alphaproteobacteria bacterium]MCK5590361.1 hypothetical protein [Candidatus Paceibacterota bacterium]
MSSSLHAMKNIFNGVAPTDLRDAAVIALATIAIVTATAAVGGDYLSQFNTVASNAASTLVDVIETLIYQPPPVDSPFNVPKDIAFPTLRA